MAGRDSAFDSFDEIRSESDWADRPGNAGKVAVGEPGGRAVPGSIQQASLMRAKRSRLDDLGSAPWHGTAFLVEAVLLLLFVTISLGVVVSLLGKSHLIGAEANQTTYAATLASTGARNGAEAFSANPKGVVETTYYEVVNGVYAETDQYLSSAYTVTCKVKPKRMAGGTLYSAVITVKRHNVTLVQLDTAKYVSEGRG